MQAKCYGDAYIIDIIRNAAQATPNSIPYR